MDMWHLNSWFEKRSRLFWILVGFGLIVLLGVIDFLTGYELNFALFYLAPISLAAWFVGKGTGLVMSIVSAVIWVTSDIASHHLYSSPMFYLWNMSIRLAFFVIVTLLLAELHKAFKTEQELARTDHLTGAANNRYFYELAQTELVRSQRYRHPLSLAYIDLDNFKTVNDRFGHTTGNKALRAIVNKLQSLVRRTDVIGRLGGDEFVMLLPETNQAEAQAIFSRIHSELEAEMTRNGWPVTLSIGVVTCENSPTTVDELVRMADALMYNVKAQGKNSVGYTLLGAENRN